MVPYSTTHVYTTTCSTSNLGNLFQTNIRWELIQNPQLMGINSELDPRELIQNHRLVGINSKLTTDGIANVVKVTHPAAPGEKCGSSDASEAASSAGHRVVVHPGTYRPRKPGQALIWLNRQHDGISRHGYDTAH